MKKKKITDVIMLFLLMFCSILTFTTNVSAASIETNGGLEYSISSDKNEYSADDSIRVTSSVKNTNSYNVEGISIETILPEGLILKTGDISVSNISIEPNGVYSVSVEAQLSDELKNNKNVSTTTPEDKSSNNVSDGKKTNSASTGDKSNVFLWIILLIISAIALIYVIKNKKKLKIFSLFLCVVIVLTMLPLNAFATEGNVATSFISVDTVVTVDGKQYTIVGRITKPENNNSKNINFNMDGILYDSDSNTYYIFEEKTTLDGTIRDLDNLTDVTYSITDCNSKELMGGSLTPSANWTINDLGLIVGENNITISLKYENGTIESSSIKVNNLCEENMQKLNVDRGDDDNDGVLNFIEEMYHTNKQSADSDGDKLSDYEEMAILGTNPIQKDSDGNGINDSEEDLDGDGLSNYDEIYLYNTNSVSVDSDGDGLSDLEEINTYHTSPINDDSDGDGATDYWEIQYGFDPLTFNSDFGDLNPAGDNTIFTENGSEITIILDDAFLNEQTAGYMGVDPYQVELGDNASTNIAVPFDSSILNEEDTPTLYYFNEDTQRLEEVPTTISEDGQAVATVDKSGKYILLNRRYVTDVWENDIIPPSSLENNQGSINIVFVIDRSASMDSNDPEGIRKTVVKEFINKLRNIDKAAIVQYTAISETIMHMTNDKEALINAVDSIQNSDGGGCAGSDDNAGTNGAAGLRNALDELSNSTAQYKYIIFLTDGDDTTSPEGYTYSDLEREASGSGVVIHTVGLVGTGSVNIDLLKEIANETGGNYYLATTGSEAEDVPEDVLGLEDVYEDIEHITIDRFADTNHDGITDYYTKLICEGKLLTSKNTRIFGNATYEQVQQNADFDGDGLLNGEEIVIKESESSVYAKIISYPDIIDSDGDEINDFIEVKNIGTSPLKVNTYVFADDVDWVTDDTRFVSNKYLDFYESKIMGELEEGSVYIGNVFFGTSYDISVLYQYALVNYFNDINKHLVVKAEIQNAYTTAELLTDEVFNSIDEAVDRVINEGGTEEELKTLYKFFENVLSNIPGTASSAIDLSRDLNGLSKKEIASEIKRLTALAKDYDGSWLNVKNSGFASNVDYYKYCDDLFNQYKGFKDQISTLENELTITKKLEKFGGVINKIGFVFTVTDVVIEGWDSYKEYEKMIANIDMMQSNIYILDCIINNNYNDSDRDFSNAELVNAAKTLKYNLLGTYTEDMTSLVGFLSTQSYRINVTSKIFGEGIHVIVSNCGVPGKIIELIRGFGNIAFNMDDVSKECAKLYAISKTSHILSDRYIVYLNSGNAKESTLYWVFYNDTGKLGITYLFNLFTSRVSSETQMISADQANSFLIEWLFANVMYKVEDCQTNITECQHRMMKY